MTEAQPSTRIALKNAVARLVQVLDRETAALRSREPVDLDELCDRKNQALLELSRIGRRFDREDIDPELRPMLAELRQKLDENRTVLTLHLQAVQEVAEILTAAIRDAESDGTYSGGHAGQM
jgi:flagellar biosynthesis/type III secretory pathway chaperone